MYSILINVLITCYSFFAIFSNDWNVDYGADDSFQSSYLGSQSKSKQHEEENYGPEWCCRKFHYSLRENDKHHTGTFYCLFFTK